MASQMHFSILLSFLLTLCDIMANAIPVTDSPGPIFKDVEKSPMNDLILTLLPPRLEGFKEEIKSAMKDNIKTTEKVKPLSRKELKKVVNQAMKQTLRALEELEDINRVEKQADTDLVEGINMMVERNETLDKVVDDTLLDIEKDSEGEDKSNEKTVKVSEKMKEAMEEVDNEEKVQTKKEIKSTPENVNDFQSLDLLDKLDAEISHDLIDKVDKDISQDPNRYEKLKKSWNERMFL